MAVRSRNVVGDEGVVAVMEQAAVMAVIVVASVVVLQRSSIAP